MIESHIERLTDRGSCRGDCICGCVYYNSSGSWDWEDGELEDLEAAPRAYDVDYTVTSIESFDGSEYVVGCDCGGAERIEQWLIDNAEGIADVLMAHADDAENYARALEMATDRVSEAARKI